MPVNMTQRMAQLNTDVRSNQKKNQFSNLMLNISFHTQNIYYTSRTKPFPLKSTKNYKKLQRKTLFHEKSFHLLLLYYLKRKLQKWRLFQAVKRYLDRYS